jgi:hypothetical protein
MTTSTMITIRMMVPMPINMGSSQMRAGLAGRHCVYLAGRALGAVVAFPGALGDAVRGRVSYFLKTSLIFSPACLRRPLA